MKKSFLLLLTLITCFPLVPFSSFASTNNFSVIFNGKPLTFSDQQPVIDNNNRTLVPARAVFEAMFAKVEWDAENSKVTIKHPSAEIVLTVDSEFATVNGKKVQMDTKAVLISERTMLPLRFVSEAIGSTVEYEYKNRTHVIKITWEKVVELPAGESFIKGAVIQATNGAEAKANLQVIANSFPQSQVYNDGSIVAWNPETTKAIIENRCFVMQSNPGNSDGEELKLQVKAWPIKSIPVLASNEYCLDFAKKTRDILMFYSPEYGDEMFQWVDSVFQKDNTTYQKKKFGDREIGISPVGMGNYIHISYPGKTLNH